MIWFQTAKRLVISCAVHPGRGHHDQRVGADVSVRGGGVEKRGDDGFEALQEVVPQSVERGAAGVQSRGERYLRSGEFESGAPTA
jgi:hypothetical protein